MKSVTNFTAALMQPNSAFAQEVFLVLQRQFAHQIERIDGSIAAGQAVASAVYQIIGLGDAPFRDLDLFWTDCDNAPTQGRYHPDRVIELNKSDGNIAFVRDLGASPVGSKLKSQISASHSFGHFNFETITVGDYYIKDTFTDPDYRKINHITTSLKPFEDMPDRLEKARSTVTNFDINCCQVALDLETLTLVATDDFIEFLRTQTLRVVNFNTSMHSAIRLEKKAKDIGFANVDMEEQIYALQTHRQFVIIVEEARRQNGRHYWPLYGNAFSSVYKERFDESSDDIKSAFNLNVEIFVFYDTFNSKDNQMIQHKAVVPLFFLTPKAYSTSFINAAKVLLPYLPDMKDANALMRLTPIVSLIENNPMLASVLKEVATKFKIKNQSASPYGIDMGILALLSNQGGESVNDMVNGLKYLSSFADFYMSETNPNNYVLTALLCSVKTFSELRNIELLYKSLDAHSDEIIDLDSVLGLLLEGKAFPSLPTSYQDVEKYRLAVIEKKQQELLELHKRLPNHIPNTLGKIIQKMADFEMVKDFGLEILYHDFSNALAHFSVVMKDGTKFLYVVKNTQGYGGYHVVDGVRQDRVFSVHTVRQFSDSPCDFFVTLSHTITRSLNTAISMRLCTSQVPQEGDDFYHYADTLKIPKGTVVGEDMDDIPF
jgi:hypothetical protein